MTAEPVAFLGSNVVALGLTAAALWGISDFLGGVAARRASAILIVAIAHGLSLALLVVTAAVLHVHRPGEGIALWGLIAGLTGGGAVILFYRALALGEMGLTAALTGLLTALVPVAVSWRLEGRPSGTQLAGFVIAAAAICLIAYQPPREPGVVPGSAPHRGALLLATLAGFGFGAFLVASKYASPPHAGYAAVLWPLAYSRFASASLAWTIVLALNLGRRMRTGSQRGFVDKSEAVRGNFPRVLLLAGTAGILEVIGNLVYMLSTLAGRLDVAAVLSSLYPAGTILLAVALLKERATPSKTLGMVLALLAVVVISL
jgi:drug/metabolite transporter (DMT)-like permease